MSPEQRSALERDLSEARKKLASLGYLSAGPSSANAGGLDDPKDRIRTFEELRTGLGDLTAGNSAKAHAIFTKLLKENPRMLDVWDMDSKVLIQLGRPEEALAALKKTVDLAPEAARAPYLREVANLCLQLGKWDEALKHAEASLAIDERLSALDRSNATWQQDVRVCRDLVARLRQSRRRLVRWRSIRRCRSPRSTRPEWARCTAST